MNRIEEKFKRLRGEGRKAFMPFVTACDPTPEACVEIVCALEKAGADMVELGFAYSDPLADGPVIQDSYARVLGRRTSVSEDVAVVREIRKRSEVPIAAMVSYSIVWRRGVKDFVRELAEAGADALIVPDLPVEEAAELISAADAAGLGVVFLVTPTTPPERARKIAEASKPFIYYVSVVGITGARAALPPELAAGVKLAKSMTEKPVVVGFGVSTPEQAAEVARSADGVIIGSAIVRVVSQNREKPTAELIRTVSEFARPIADAMRG